MRLVLLIVDLFKLIERYDNRLMDAGKEGIKLTTNIRSINKKSWNAFFHGLVRNHFGKQGLSASLLSDQKNACSIRTVMKGLQNTDGLRFDIAVDYFRNIKLVRHLQIESYLRMHLNYIVSRRETFVKIER